MHRMKRPDIYADLFEDFDALLEEFPPARHSRPCGARLAPTQTHRRASILILVWRSTFPGESRNSLAVGASRFW